MDQQPKEGEQNTAQDYLAHGKALYRYALSRVADPHTAEDLVQDTLVTAVDKSSDFAGRSAMLTWLTGILRHKILDHYRWKKRHPGDLPNQTDEQDQDQSEPWFTPLGVWRQDPNQGLDNLSQEPDRALEMTELRAAIQRCVDLLPEQQHRVFVLREMEELEPDEVCQSVGIARKSLAVFLYRARQALRSCLQNKWVAP